MSGLARAAWLAALLTGCGHSSSEPADPVPAALVGRWQANAACAPPCAFTLAWKANPQARLDVIATLGMAFDMEFERNGRFRFDYTPGTSPPPGQVRVSGGTLIVTATGGAADTIDFELEGSSLRLQFRREWVELDFDGDGQLDPSVASAVFVRR